AVERDIGGQVGATLYRCPLVQRVRVVDASVPHLNDVVYAIDSSCAGSHELNPCKPVVVSASIGHKSRQIPVLSWYDLRHVDGVCWLYPASFGQGIQF